MTGGGDLPALGAGQAGEAPGAGRTPSLRGSAGLRTSSRAPDCPRPAARAPGPWAGNEAPSSRRAWWRRRRLPGSWLGLGLVSV